MAKTANFVKQSQKAAPKPRFHYSHRTEGARAGLWQRLLQMVPGSLSWVFLLSVITLCVFKPIVGAAFVIAFDLYWLLRIFYMAVFLILAYALMQVEKDANWIKHCRLLERREKGLVYFKQRLRKTWKYWRFREWLGLKNQERELNKLLASGVLIPAFDSIYHVVIITAAKEGKDVILPALEALRMSQFPTGRILPILAIEKREGAAQLQMAESLREEFRDEFFEFLIVSHPDGLRGEEKVKGANATYAAKAAAKFLSGCNIPFENVIVSCFDADTVAGPEYFAALTYRFMRHPKRTRASFQPIPVYHNNIWEASGIARVLEMGASFFQMIEATNPEKLVTFSSHSMSFKALVEVGYWPVDMVSDDSAIFWKALIHYDGDYSVEPMYITLSMDVVMAKSFGRTIVNIYKQKRRWGWGIENFPIVMRAFLKPGKMSFWKKSKYTAKLLEMNFTWATFGFMITFISWLPTFFAGQEFSDSILYYNAPRITGIIFNLASASILLMIVLSWLLLPKHKRVKRPIHQRILFALEWLLTPIVLTFLSALPALDAQTKLMRGRILGFWNTEKSR